MRRPVTSKYPANEHLVRYPKLWRTNIRVLFVVGLAALFSAPYHAALAQEEDVIEAGRQEFSQKCMVCHGMEGNGDGVLAPHLTAQPSDLSLLSKQNGGTFPFWETYGRIDGRNVEVVNSHGTNDMPVWGTDEPYKGPGGALPMGQILAIVFFLQSIQEE